MRNLIQISLLIFTCIQVHGQTVDYNRIILPNDVKYPSLEERLVQLAWANHPENKIFQNEVESSAYKIVDKKAAWLEKILIQGNLNEFTLAGSDDVRSQFFPRYNFGISIPLGIFVQIPQEVKIAKKEYESAIESVNARKLYIRSETLKRYQNYQRLKETFDIQSQMTQDVENQLSLTESKFKSGEETFENYSKVLEKLNHQKMNLLNTKYDLNLAIIELEELIGLKLEEVLQL